MWPCLTSKGFSEIDLEAKHKSAKVSKNVETKVKATLAALGTKKKKKVYKKAKSKIDEAAENIEITKKIKVPEFSSIDELSKIFEKYHKSGGWPNDKILFRDGRAYKKADYEVWKRVNREMKFEKERDETKND